MLLIMLQHYQMEYQAVELQLVMNQPFYWYFYCLLQVWTEEGEEESEMTCSERLQAELQDDPGDVEIRFWIEFHIKFQVEVPH